jgi:rod shape determining protein RodA
MIFFGWMNIYSANILEADSGILDLTQRFGKQLIWIAASFILAVMILAIDAKFYIYFSYVFYGILMVVLVAVLLVGTEINGARSWFVIGGFQFQPSEFAKPITALALARFLTSEQFQIRRFLDLAKAGIIILIPPALIMLQPDLGSTLVYGSFIFVLFREGFSSNTMIMLFTLVFLFLATLLMDKALLLLLLVVTGLLIYWYVSKSFKKTIFNALWLAGLFGILFGLNELSSSGFSLFALGLATVLIIASILAVKGFTARRYEHLKILAGVVIAILFTVSVDFAMNRILKPHQQHRIHVAIGLVDDPKGIGYNVNQSKIAIGSGGFSGKGYLEGTQTKLHFVPEQSTDFIFCTVGEEWGFLGTSFVIILYVVLLLRMIILAERQRSRFSRIFGYGFISILYTHFLINIGMTIGLLPVIGIPLPFFSYGGSSLWAFTMFFFIFLRLDASRLEML